ncbi:hypothetical protein GGX14DRAFT_701769 [Mycena pura]|uniref:Uncharacterized protein n=1 Tax=Mycena pura TaxID=153505 RepID=A0AAD6UP67_9AGAR|nr:hypothetical protein GGX14DRAFT_701769 [Mycena pura]
MFVGCHNFAIQVAGSLNNISNSEEDGNDYYTIRPADINLLCWAREDNVVKHRVVRKNRRRGVCYARIVRGKRTTRHAKIFGSPDTFTVITYENPDFAHDQWKLEVEAYSTQRHHFLFQIFGITKSRSMNAFVFHNELIPAEEAISKFPTHLTRIYSLYVLGMQFEDFRRYCEDPSHINYQGWFNIPSSEWFRLSTGSLSLEHGDHLPWYKDFRKRAPDRLGSFQTLIPSKCLSDADLMRTMQIEDLLAMIPDRSRFDSMPDLPLRNEHIHLGALYSFDTPGPSVTNRMVSFPTTTKISQECPFWKLRGTSFSFDKLEPINCTRCVMSPRSRNSTMTNIFASSIGLHQLQQIKLQEHHSFDWYLKLEDVEVIATAWLAQANHAFVTAPFWKGSSSADGVALTTELRFTVKIHSRLDNCLRGTFMADPPTNDLFLFLANPKAEIQNGILSVALARAENTFYWSFEPDGSIPLTPEELEDLAPPEVIVNTHIGTRTWIKEDYQLIKEFCVVKGIDPESTNLAIQLGYPLAVADNYHSRRIIVLCVSFITAIIAMYVYT